MVTFSSTAETIRDLKKRYRDAFLVSNVTVAFGNLIKTVGILLAIVIVVGALILSSQGGGTGVAVVGIVMAIIAGLLFYLLGVLVAAQGQILQATLDTAVNSSPFLLDADRAEIMSLSYTPSTSAVSIDERVEVAEPQEGQWKCKCGQINSKELTNCAKCKRVPGAIY